MKEINAKRSEFIKVEIDEHEERSIVRSYLDGLLNLDKCYDCYSINTNRLIGTKDYGGHGSGYEEDTIIREATELDKAVVRVLNQMGNR